MELLVSNITNVIKAQNQTEFAIFWFIPIILAAGAAGAVVGGVIGGLIGNVLPDMNNIVILGSKGSGKTTLWSQLRGKFTSSCYKPTGKERVEQFQIETSNGKRRISSTIDIGGDDLWVSDYENLISKNGTFIFYLVDLTTVQEKKAEIRARLLKVLKIIEEKKLENCGIKILGTFHDVYQKRSNEQANIYIRKVLNLNSLNGLDNIITIPINLLDRNDIDKIKDEIID